MLKIKEWKYNDLMSKVTRYGDKWMDLDWERNPEYFDTVTIDEEGYATFTGRVEVKKETEKAYQIELADSWIEWFPKSAVIF